MYFLPENSIYLLEIYKNMIHIDGTTQTLLFPKNIDGVGPFSLIFHSELSQKNYSFTNLSDEGSRGYLTFTINTSMISPGEYNYSILDYEGTEVGKGLAVCDVEESNPTVKFYEINSTVKEYVPKYRPTEPMRVFVPFAVDSSATTISFKMVSALPWAMTVYNDGRQIGETIYGSSGTTEGEIEIPENLTKDSVIYEFAYGDEDGEYSFETNVIQRGIPFSVSISCDAKIPFSATTIPFEVRYSEFNTMRIGWVSLFKNGEKVDEIAYGRYPLVFASSFTINENTTEEPINYELQVKTDSSPLYESVSASTTCIQENENIYLKKRFTIEMLEPGDIEWDATSIFYSLNGEDGYQLDHGVFGLDEGDIVEFYVNEDTPNQSFQDKTIISTGEFKVYGNIMSLLYVDYATATTLNVARQFQRLLSGNAHKLLYAGDLRLPATTLSDFCYMSMLAGCRSLLTVPSLPATTLTQSCYAYMFSYTAIREAPALPATTLASACYSNMFEGCINLENAPELPAKTLTLVCYNSIFYGCTNLHYVKCLATDISAVNCTNGWLSGVSETGTFVKSPNMVSWTTGVNGIPSGWEIENDNN